MCAAGILFLLKPPATPLLLLALLVQDQKQCGYFCLFTFTSSSSSPSSCTPARSLSCMISLRWAQHFTITHGRSTPQSQTDTSKDDDDRWVQEYFGVMNGPHRLEMAIFTVFSVFGAVVIQPCTTYTVATVQGTMQMDWRSNYANGAEWILHKKWSEQYFSTETIHTYAVDIIIYGYSFFCVGHKTYLLIMSPFASIHDSMGHSNCVSFPFVIRKEKQTPSVYSPVFPHRHLFWSHSSGRVRLSHQGKRWQDPCRAEAILNWWNHLKAGKK